MDKLPLEVIVNIASYLPKHLDDGKIPLPLVASNALVRPGIASLSRRWQFAVESTVFRDIELKSTEMDEFSGIFSAAQSHRRRFLKDLSYNIILPTYSEADFPTYESDQDRLANDTAASAAVLRLFSVLATWGSDPGLSIRLSISVHSPTDLRRYNINRQEYDFERLMERISDLIEKRYEYSYTSLPSLGRLPLVPCITSMDPYGGERNFHPTALVKLTAHTPSVERLDWRYNEPYVYFPLRRQIRGELTESLSTLTLPPSTQIFNLDLGWPCYQHHHRLPNFIHPHKQDPYCTALHRLLRPSKITRIFYRGPLSPSFFWPYSDADSLPTPFFPSLKDLHIEFPMDSPSGHWYFRGDPLDEFNIPSSDEPLAPDTVGHFPPGYGTAEEAEAAIQYAKSMRHGLTYNPDNGTSDGREDFRTVVNNEVMLPLLEALARAAGEMMALEWFHVSTELAQGRGAQWFVEYVAPGKKHEFEKYTRPKEMQDWDAEEQRKRQYKPLDDPTVFLHVEKWRPDEKVVELFQAIGRKRWGRDARVVFLPYLY